MLSDGTVAHLYQLENEHLRVDVTDYGVRLVSLVLKQSGNGPDQQLIMGQFSLAEYERDSTYAGAVVGRTCNRIAQSQFVLAGETYTLEANEDRHHLHGGFSGFHRRCWRVTPSPESLLFEYESPAGEGGYPGNVKVWVRISLDENALRYEFGGTSDHLTLLDMTNHAYFCLDDSGNVSDHELQIKADYFAPIDREMIPTGELKPVDQTPFDYRASKRVGAEIADDDQVLLANGYDHAFLLDSESSSQVTLYSPRSRVEMTVQTDLPAVQLYTGNYLPNKYAALCLETQHLPNACNQANFKTPVCSPDNPYEAQTTFRFRYRG